MKAVCLPPNAVLAAGKAEIFHQAPRAATETRGVVSIVHIIRGGTGLIVESCNHVREVHAPHGPFAEILI